MRSVDYKTYNKEKKNFMEAHNYNYRIETSPMDSTGTYHKDYLFEDGAQWHEVMRPTFETAEVEIKKVKCQVVVKMLETEYYNTETGTSSYYYERF